MALTAALKAQIAQWYKALQQHIPGFISRAPQREMIAEVAKTLTGEAGRHLVIEAPTGVGKTFAYLIPGIAISRQQQTPLIVSTANVALQDQIFSKDLPLLKKIIPDLQFTAAFGRGRYVCPRNLAMLAADQDQQGELLFYLDDDRLTSKDEQSQSARLEEALNGYRWDGVRDHLDETITDELWGRLSTDRTSCLGHHCHWYRQCPFFIARREIADADVVVINHALVIAALESESVLPPAKHLLLVVDEGHHLPEVVRDRLEVNGDITPAAVSQQLDLFCRLVEQCMAQFRPKSPPPMAANPEKLKNHCEIVREQLQQLERLIMPLLPANVVHGEFRFEMGILPAEMLAICGQLFKLNDSLRGLAEALLNHLSDQTGQFDVVRLNRMFLQMNRAFGIFEALTKLWRLAALEQVSGAPVSKWVVREQREGSVHVILHCAGIRVNEQLEKLLWKSIPHVVITSATLRSLNSFQRLQEMSGLSEKASDRFIALDSPFSHLLQGKLLIPKMRYEPLLEQETEHLAEMAHFFRHQVAADKHRGLLVLFVSNRAMQLFLSHLTDLRLLMLVQGDQPRYRLVELHRQRIMAGEKSILVGLQSFAEGLDLKGGLLSQVHIHKIAFPPVDSPVMLTEGEWLKSLKRYPFEVQSLPNASFTLIQQVGRLIRSHECHGEIIIYDRRLISKRYGARLLAALPVFPIEQPAVPADIAEVRSRHRE
ncbi:ATP-dependent DNA helicase DinG [Enterobacteriaceae bacterium LUAb1]